MEKKYIIPAIALGIILAGCGKIDTPANTMPTESGTTEAASTEPASEKASSASSTSAEKSSEKKSKKTTEAKTTAASGSSATSASKASGQTARRTSADNKTTKTDAAKTTSKRTGNAPAQPATPPAVTSTVTTAAPTENKHTAPSFTDGSFTFRVCENGLDVYMNGQKVQTIHADTEEILRYLETRDTASLAQMTLFDFDCDGYNDLFLPQQIGVLNTFGVYYHYSAETDTFVKWDEMKEIDTFADVNSDGTFSTTVRYSDSEYELRTYGWDENGAPLLKAMEKQYIDSDEQDSVFVDYYDYSSGSEELIKRERLLFDDEHKVMGAEEVEIN